jgi:hypothetical protein
MARKKSSNIWASLITRSMRTMANSRYLPPSLHGSSRDYGARPGSPTRQQGSSPSRDSVGRPRDSACFPRDRSGAFKSRWEYFAYIEASVFKAIALYGTVHNGSPSDKTIESFVRAKARRSWSPAQSKSLSARSELIWTDDAVVLSARVKVLVASIMQPLAEYVRGAKPLRRPSRAPG